MEMSVARCNPELLLNQSKLFIVGGTRRMTESEPQLIPVIEVFDTDLMQ